MTIKLRPQSASPTGCMSKALQSDLLGFVYLDVPKYVACALQLLWAELQCMPMQCRLL